MILTIIIYYLKSLPIQKKIAIIKIYFTIGIYNDNTYHLRIIIESWTYIVKHLYLNNLKFYLDITDLYTRFGIDFIFSKTGKCSCHKFFFIYYSFFFIHFITISNVSSINLFLLLFMII